MCRKGIDAARRSCPKTRAKREQSRPFTSKVEDLEGRRRGTSLRQCKEGVRTCTPLSPSPRRSRAVARRRPGSAETLRSPGSEAHTSKRQKDLPKKCSTGHRHSERSSVRANACSDKAGQSKARAEQKSASKRPNSGRCESNGKRELTVASPRFFSQPAPVEGHQKAEFSPRCLAAGPPSIDSGTARRNPSRSKRANRAHCASPVPVLFAHGRCHHRPREAPGAAAVKGEPSPGPASKHTGATTHACIKFVSEDRVARLRFCDVPSQVSLSMPLAFRPDHGCEMSAWWLDSVKERSSLDNGAVDSA